MEKAVRRKRNKSTNLLLLILFALACIGAYVAVHHFEAQKESQEETGEEDSFEALLQADTEDAKSLSYEYNGQKVALINDDGIWKIKSDKDYPVNQDLVAAMVTVFSDTVATKTVAEDQEECAEYGLDKPLITATLKEADGTEETLAIGMQGIGDSSENYYAKVSGKDGIYMVSINAYTPFQYEKEQLAMIEDTPSIDSDSIYKITVKERAASSFAAKKDSDGCWMITAPYESGVEADASSMSQLASAYTSYSFAKNADYRKESYATYGLEDPAYTVTVNYTEETEAEETETEENETEETSETVKKAFTLFIGNEDEDGNYYVRTSDTEYVYLMSADDVKTYVDVDAFSKVETAVFTVEQEQIKKVKAVTKTQTFTYDYEDEEDTDTLDAMYAALASLTYKGEADKTAGGKESVLTLEITYGEDGKNKKTLAFIKQDENYMQVEEDGNSYFVVDSRDVDAILAAIQ